MRNWQYSMFLPPLRLIPIRFVHTVNNVSHTRQYAHIVLFIVVLRFGNSIVNLYSNPLLLAEWYDCEAILRYTGNYVTQIRYNLQQKRNKHKRKFSPGPPFTNMV